MREPQKDDIALSDDVAAYVYAIKRGWPATKDRLTEIHLETMRYPTMKVIASFIENGWPRHERPVQHSVREYFRERSSLSISDGLIIYKLQFVVPPNMRVDILQRLHETHQDISKCRERAAASVWWPGIGKAIIALVERCQTCQRNRPAQHEQPLHPT